MAKRGFPHLNFDMGMINHRYDASKCSKGCDNRIPDWSETLDEIFNELNIDGNFKLRFEKLTNEKRVILCLRHKPISEGIEKYLKKCYQASQNTCGCGVGQRKLASKS